MKTLKVNIIRGQNQIGGSIIEVYSDKTKIVFDVGINLSEDEEIEIPNVDGLFSGNKKYDAVFLTHYHADHIGLISNIIKEIPIYMGEKAFNIVQASNEYRDIKFDFKPILVKNKEEIQINDIKVTPLLCDHSAFDSYMYLIESGEKRILYTGDFRANGRLNYSELLEYLPDVDSLVIEGTTLSRDDSIENIEEELLEDIAVKAMKNHCGPAFIMMSAMNIDRLVTARNAALQCDRLFLEDVYTAMIAKASGETDLFPDKNKSNCVFMTGGDKQYELLAQFGSSKIGKEAISRNNFLMCIRPSMRNYLNKLNELCSFEDGIMFYAMWKGYLDRPDMKEFIDYMKSKGVKIHILHTSGHADAKTIDKLVEIVNPKEIIPIHTENEKWFSRYEGRHIIYECVNHEIM